MNRILIKSITSLVIAALLSTLTPPVQAFDRPSPITGFCAWNALTLPSACNPRNPQSQDSTILANQTLSSTAYRVSLKSEIRMWAEIAAVWSAVMGVMGYFLYVLLHPDPALLVSSDQTHWIQGFGTIALTSFLVGMVKKIQADKNQPENRKNVFKIEDIIGGSKPSRDQTPPVDLQALLDEANPISNPADSTASPFQLPTLPTKPPAITAKSLGMSQRLHAVKSDAPGKLTEAIGEMKRCIFEREYAAAIRHYRQNESLFKKQLKPKRPDLFIIVELMFVLALVQDARTPSGAGSVGDRHKDLMAEVRRCLYLSEELIDAANKQFELTPKSEEAKNNLVQLLDTFILQCHLIGGQMFEHNNEALLLVSDHCLAAIEKREKLGLESAARPAAWYVWRKYYFQAMRAHTFFVQFRALSWDDRDTVKGLSRLREAVDETQRAVETAAAIGDYREEDILPFEEMDPEIKKNLMHLLLTASGTLERFKTILVGHHRRMSSEEAAIRERLKPLNVLVDSDVRPVTMDTVQAVVDAQKESWYALARETSEAIRPNLAALGTAESSARSQNAYVTARTEYGYLNGWLLVETKQYEEAIAVLTQTIEDAQDDRFVPEMNGLLVVARWKAGHRPEAEELYERLSAEGSAIRNEIIYSYVQYWLDQAEKHGEGWRQARAWMRLGLQGQAMRVVERVMSLIEWDDQRRTMDRALLETASLSELETAFLGEAETALSQLMLGELERYYEAEERWARLLQESHDRGDSIDEKMFDNAFAPLEENKSEGWSALPASVRVWVLCQRAEDVLWAPGMNKHTRWPKAFLARARELIAEEELSEPALVFLRRVILRWENLLLSVSLPNAEDRLPHRKAYHAAALWAGAVSEAELQPIEARMRTLVERGLLNTISAVLGVIDQKQAQLEWDRIDEALTVFEEKESDSNDREAVARLHERLVALQARLDEERMQSLSLRIQLLVERINEQERFRSEAVQGVLRDIATILSGYNRVLNRAGLFRASTPQEVQEFQQLNATFSSMDERVDALMKKVGDDKPLERFLESHFDEILEAQEKARAAVEEASRWFVLIGTDKRRDDFLKPQKPGPRLIAYLSEKQDGAEESEFFEIPRDIAEALSLAWQRGKITREQMARIIGVFKAASPENPLRFIEEAISDIVQKGKEIVAARKKIKTRSPVVAAVVPLLMGMGLWMASSLSVSAAPLDRAIQTASSVSPALGFTILSALLTLSAVLHLIGARTIYRWVQDNSAGSIVRWFSNAFHFYRHKGIRSERFHYSLHMAMMRLCLGASGLLVGMSLFLFGLGVWMQFHVEGHWGAAVSKIVLLAGTSFFAIGLWKKNLVLKDNKRQWHSHVWNRFRNQKIALGVLALSVLLTWSHILSVRWIFESVETLWDRLNNTATPSFIVPVVSAA